MSEPFTGMRMLWMTHNPIFDRSPMRTDEQICTPPKETMMDYIAKNSRLVFLDMSEGGKPNIKDITP